jgi:hypothetical protein
LLGRKIIEKMKFEQVEPIFLEKDYKSRIVLQIILDNGIKEFIVRQKLRFLLKKIWDGKDFDLVDGKLKHFSYILHIKDNHNPR